MQPVDLELLLLIQHPNYLNIGSLQLKPSGELTFVFRVIEHMRRKPTNRGLAVSQPLLTW
jgi:hypothetical protein